MASTSRSRPAPVSVRAPSRKKKPTAAATQPPVAPAVPARVVPRVRAVRALSVQPAEVEGEGRQSPLARGIGLLQCFTTAQPMLAGKELVERSGLPKPTAF